MADSERIVYKGEVYWLQKSGRYFASRKPLFGERLLHRRIWSEANGPIQKGFEVHHRNGDWRDCALDNLECLEGRSHWEKHSHERRAVMRKNIDSGRIDMDKARELAKLWHSSPEGLEWHSVNGKRSWDWRETESKVCVRCGTEYDTYFATRSRFCSDACAQSVAVRRYFTDNRTCAFCGKPFVANRHRDTACCSRVCSNRKRAADARVQPDVGAG